MSRRETDPRLLELLTARDVGGLSPEEHAELEVLLEGREADSLVGELVLAMDAADGAAEDMPGAVRNRLAMRGRMLVEQERPSLVAGDTPGSGGGAPRVFWPLAAAILLCGLGATVWWATGLQSQRSALRAETEILQARIEDNELLLDGAEARLASIRMELEATEGLAEERLMELAAAEETRIEMARRLSDITSKLDRAELAIARYETPVDPAVLAENRRKLLEVPDTVRVAWQPFALAEAPPEQAGEVSGDVVWNDELEQGYLRFVGLRPNDPATEQYQVWIIDERGLEQKVSGGVFNASADGEVIVPLEPGIDVGRVALFAVTIEEPGGTWVPSLDRRVVVAPRGES